MVLSVQLYTVRDAMAADAMGTLQKLRAMGFERVELAGTYGHDARGFRTMLDDAGLLVSGSHVGLEALETDLQSLVDDHMNLECERIILPWLPESTFDAGVEALARRLGTIADSLEPHGMEFGYHNHAFEVERGWLGQLFAMSPSNVKAQLDLGWIAAAGEDPGDWVRKIGARVATVHLKDVTNDPASRDAVAGEGIVDWDDVLAKCQEAGVMAGVIEMDVPPGDPLECVERCLRFFEDRVAK